MKPKTRLQREVAELIPSIKPMSPDQEQYGQIHCFDHIAFLRSGGKEAICSECGHRFMPASTEARRYRCPQCGMVIKPTRKHRSVRRDKSYYMVIDKAGRFQVLRWFLFEAVYKAGKEAWYDSYEVSRIFIAPEGRVRVERSRASGYYIDSFSLSSDLEIRAGADSVLDDILPYAVYHRKRIIPELRMRGFNGSLHGMAPVRLIEALLHDSKAETLIKCGQYRLLAHFLCNRSEPIAYYWPSIKICIRNGYTVKDGSMWCDMLSALRYLGKDLHSPRYVCPPDLKEAHDEYMRMSERKSRMEAAEKRRLDRAKADDAYLKEKAAFLGIALTDGEIHIEPLQSVNEFEEEGKAMHHCVYLNEYYRKPSLILSARIDGKRIETVEVSLKSFKVVQSRGLCNKNTEYHDRIIRLVQENMGMIRKCAKSA